MSILRENYLTFSFDSAYRLDDSFEWQSGGLRDMNTLLRWETL